MNKLMKIALATPALLLFGCAPTSKFSYVAPKINTIDTSVSVYESKDVVWARLVKNLSSNFFVINNLEKDSGLINVSFSSSNPNDYLTCGQSKRSFKNANGEKTYVYDPVEATGYSTTFGNVAYNVRRSSNLNGRANIYVSDTGPETNVTVNVIFNANVTLKYYNFATGAFLQSESFNFTPTSKTPYGDGDITCVSNGKVESKLLKLVNLYY